MAKKETTKQPDLFAMDLEQPTPTPERKIKIPPKEAVKALVNKTGESTRKCYHWLLADLNK